MQSSNTGSSEEISEIVQSLPKCSHFRLELERGARGTGVEQHYMELMRKQRTKRATIHVTCALIRGRASGPFLVTRRLYFREYDGPDAEITDPEALKRIRESGLEHILDNAAIEKARHAPIFAGIEHTRKVLKSSHALMGEIDFIDLPFLPQGLDVLVPTAKDEKPLIAAALAGDVVEVTAGAKHTSKEILDQALFFATARRQDNSSVITSLIAAGADVNSHFGSAQATPLMWGITNPCNLRVLLQNGADINVADRKGRTALQVAEQDASSSDPLVRLSIELLRESRVPAQ